MELIEPEHKSEHGALPEPEPRYKTANLRVKRAEHGQAWARLAGGIVLAVILIVLLVLFARFIYHRAHNHASPSTPVTHNTPSLSSNNSKAGTAPSASSNSGSSSTNANFSSTSSSSTSKTQTPNTGPGNVVAIFAGASLAAAGLHYLISVRRFAKNS